MAGKKRFKDFHTISDMNKLYAIWAPQNSATWKGRQEELRWWWRRQQDEIRLLMNHFLQ